MTILNTKTHMRALQDEMLSIIFTGDSHGTKRSSRMLRPCLYCQNEYANLSRHIRNVHTQEKEVAEIIEGNFSTIDEKRLFARLRDKGVLLKDQLKASSEQPRENPRDETGEDTRENIKENTRDDPRDDEKSGRSGIAYCNVCHGTFSRMLYSRHQQRCQPQVKRETEQIKTEVETDRRIKTGTGGNL